MPRLKKLLRRLGTRLGGSPIVRLLTSGQFAIYSAGNCVSLLGTWMQRIGCSLLVWNMTESTFWLGILAAADLLPTLFIGPFAGAAADRWDTLRLNRICQAVLTAVAALMTILIVCGFLSLTMLIALVALQGCVIALSQPARLALVQELVAREDIPAAVAINSMNVNLARLVGPAIAGLMVVHFDVAWVFLLNAIVTAIFVATLGVIATVRNTERAFGRNVLADIVAGFRYLIADRGMRVMLFLLLIGGVTIRSVAEMLPAFAAEHFSQAATGLAVLTSTMALGSILAGFSMGTYLVTSRLPQQIILSWLLSAIAVIGFALAPHSWLLSSCAMAMGFFTSLALIGTQTFVQLRAPPPMRGRALSVHGLLFRASPSLGALMLGFASDLFRLTVPAVASGGIMLLVALVFLPSAKQFGSGLSRDDR